MVGGVHQGCPASPLLFSLLFDRVCAYLRAHAPTRLRPRTPFLVALAIFALLYADDVALVASSPERM